MASLPRGNPASWDWTLPLGRGKLLRGGRPSAWAGGGGSPPAGAAAAAPRPEQAGVPAAFAGPEGARGHSPAGRRAPSHVTPPPHAAGMGSRVPPSQASAFLTTPAPGARVWASLLGPNLLCAAGRHRKVRDFPPRDRARRRGTGLDGSAGRGGRRRPERLSGSSAWPGPPTPCQSPPYTHPEVKSCCTLSSRSRRVSSIAAAVFSPLRSQPAALTLTTRPAPGPGLAPAPQPLPRFSPARALSPRPAPARAAAVGRAGLRLRKRGGPSLPSENADTFL